MKFGDAISLYQGWRRSQHMADSTLKTTECGLRHLRKFCDGIGLNDVRNATTQTLLSFTLWVRKAKGSKGTWSQNYQAFLVWTAQDFFRYLYETERVLTDITLGLPPMHKAKTLPRNLMNREQVTRLLHQPDLSKPEGFRDRTIFELLYSSGLGGGEVCDLTPYDLDLHSRVVRIVQGKGRKDRNVPVGKVATQFLQEYTKRVKPVLLKKKQKPDGRLFLMGTQRLRNRFNHHCEGAKLGGGFTVHSVRHSCATEMLRGGAKDASVDELIILLELQIQKEFEEGNSLTSEADELEQRIAERQNEHDDLQPIRNQIAHSHSLEEANALIERYEAEKPGQVSSMETHIENRDTAPNFDFPDIN